MKALIALVLFVSVVYCISENDVDNASARLCVDAYKDKHEIGSYKYATHVERYAEGTMVANTYADKPNKIFYVAIRGTELTWSDWKNNAKFRQEALVFHIDGQEQNLGYVHRGFKNKAEEIARLIEKEYTSKFRGYRIVITGHSQGGANAYIVALHFALRLNRNDIQVVTFGAPRVGDAKFTETMQKYVPNMRRYVGKDWLLRVHDIVTMLPRSTPMLIDYQHPCDEILITSVKSGPLDVHSMPNYESALHKFFENGTLIDEDAEVLSESDMIDIVNLLKVVAKLRNKQKKQE